MAIKKIDQPLFKGTVKYNPRDKYYRVQEIRDAKTGYKLDPIQWLRDITTREEYRFTGFKRGYIYHYKYQPKYKDTLLFYDRMPLCIFLKPHADGKTFYCYNLHFIPMNYREKIFKEFRYKAGKDGEIVDESIWVGLETIRRFYPIILRRYLYTHIQGKVYPIPMRAYDMQNVKLFPSEYFFKMNSDQIFRLAMLNYYRKR